MARKKLKVKDVMKTDVAYVTLPGTRDDVLKILKEKMISGVPVVKDGAVVGVVTRTDLLRKPYEDQLALLMSRNPVTISPEESLVNAAKLMLNKNIRRLPVVKNKKLAGIITVADLVRAIADMKIKEPISKYMEDSVVALWDEMPLPLAGKIMELAFVKACPVLNSKEELVGMISDRDLIAASKIEDRVEKSDSSSTDEDLWTWEATRETMKLYYEVSKVRLPDVPLKQVMVKNVVTALRSTEVSECADKMRRHKFDQLPVVDAGHKLIGMIYDRNLLKALIKHEGS